jgi:integrase/recombinase XerD
MPVREYLEPEETEKLEAAADCMRDKLLIRILRMAGIRISEALNLAAEDIDFKQGYVTIIHLKSRKNIICPECGTKLGLKHKFCPGCGIDVSRAVAQEKKHRRLRTIPMDTETLNMLQVYIKRGGGTKIEGRQYLFNITRQWAWKIFQGCAERANLPSILNPDSGKIHGVSPHKLRDAFAVHAIKVNDSGDGVRMLQEHMGHQNINTTMRYRKVAKTELSNWYNYLWNGKHPPEGGAKSK